jgi:3'(2'), 5'-bisphosphate nucleotidase
LQATEAVDPAQAAERLAASVREAGALALSMFGTPLKNWTKGASSPVSEADIAVDKLLQERLSDVEPGVGWLSEESVDDPARLAARFVWIVDPIDGTRGFARKNGEFSVMIGFVENSQIGVGVVAEPAVGRLTYAVRGFGCWRLDGDEKMPTRCQVTNVAELAQATLTQSRSRDPNRKSRWVEALKPARIVETYSAGIKLALVARGEADIYLNTYDAFHDWDICAGHILVEEAGGQVTGTGGQELRYGLPEAWQRNGLLATNGRLHAAALAVIRS